MAKRRYREFRDYLVLISDDSAPNGITELRLREKSKVDAAYASTRHPEGGRGMSHQHRPSRFNPERCASCARRLP